MILEDGPPAKAYSEPRPPEKSLTDYKSTCSITPGSSEYISGGYDDTSISKSPWRYANMQQKRRTLDALSQLKVCTAKLNLPTRRPSYVTWRNQHLDTLNKTSKITEAGLEIETPTLGKDFINGNSGIQNSSMQEDLECVSYVETGSPTQTVDRSGNLGELNSESQESVLSSSQDFTESQDVTGFIGLNKRCQELEEAMAAIRGELVCII